MKNIVVVTPARSGSSWLVSQFENKLGYNNFALGLGESEPENKNLTQKQRLAKLEAQQPYVTKVFCDEPFDLNLISNAEFIWLHRRNIPEHFLSMTLALTTRVFNIHKGEDYTPPEQLIIEQEHIDFFSNVMQCKEVVYAQYHHMFDYKLAYEEIFKNNPWGFVDTGDKTLKLNHYSPEWLAQSTEVCKQQGWLNV